MTSTMCTSCSYDFPSSDEEADDSGHRFSLKILLVGTALIAIAFAGINEWVIEPRRATSELRTRIIKIGGEMSKGQRFAFISLKNKPISDRDLEGLAPLMRKCPNLIYIDLSGTLVTDASIGLLETLPHDLRSNVRLENTDITDSGKLRVGGLRITNPGIIDKLNRLGEQ